MNLEEFKRDMKDKKLRAVYNKYLLGNEVWYFKKIFSSTSSVMYDKFKYYICDKLDIHFNNIAIVGSAKTGFSLNPEKSFKGFDAKSDIDIVLVSAQLFNTFWNAYTQEFMSPIGIKNGKYKYVASGIFRKFITLEGFDDSNEVYNNWEKKTLGFQKDLQLLFKICNEVNYRIYESWEAVEHYYIKGLDDLKTKMEREGLI